MPFEPVAIVGQSCLLPGALSPQSLWEAISEGRDLLSDVPQGYWHLPPSPSGRCAELPARAGYVQGFESCFQAEGFTMPSDEVRALDPLVQWVLHCSRDALYSAGYETPLRSPHVPRTGLIFGNLGYPTTSHKKLAASIWLEPCVESLPPELRSWASQDRFHFGYPAHLAAQALGLRGPAFALDAACASALYAIKLAVDALQDRRADLMLAGAVTRPDNLFLHLGFDALKALSPTGRSRPFESDADGLVPSEGAAFVVLKRLEDALSDGNRIAGIVRGIGLSNDGRQGGLLAPSSPGQIEAMRRAYHDAQIDPSTMSLVECHATGTPVGDAIELRSLKEVFGETNLTLGSVKSNLGHPICVAGAAALLKVLHAFEHESLPPNRPLNSPLAELEDSPFRILDHASSWTSESVRRAGINAFGFGGNNAHLIVEEWSPTSKISYPSIQSRPPRRVSIVSLEVVTGRYGRTADYARALLNGVDAAKTRGESMETIDVEVAGLAFPPRDLESTLPQQVAILELARQAVAGRDLPEATGVFIGANTDSDICRYWTRWQLREWGGADDNPHPLPEAWLQEAERVLTPELDAVRVVGAMPNIPANRVSTQLDVHAPSYTIAGEELSGIHALEIAERALARGEIDLAIVGAVDLCCQDTHERAAMEVLASNREKPADAAVVLVLQRTEDARRQRTPILAELVSPQETPPSSTLRLTESEADLSAFLGHAHAASGLLYVASAAIALDHRVRLSKDGASASPVAPSPNQAIEVEIEAMGAQRRTIALREGDARAISSLPHAKLRDDELLRLPAHAPRVQLPPLDSEGAPGGFLERVSHAHRRFLRIRQHEYGSSDVVPAIDPPSIPKPPRQTSPTTPSPSGFPGPKLDRQDLERLASGKISEVLGPLFARQDSYPRQVRMPEPPLLLADRVLGIEGEAGSLGKGTIWTETDVREDGWYLHEGRMPAGILIESGQADLLLISWLGVDFENRGERVYRLLGCDAVFHQGGLPKPGDTLHFEIHIDGYALHGDVRLFFFHYQCRIGDRVVLTVRHGQAGFFTDEELAQSAGILWDPDEAEHDPNLPLDPARIASAPEHYDKSGVEAFAQGKITECFGQDYVEGDGHQKTPRIPFGPMMLFDEVLILDRRGGPWGRGYLRAIKHMSPEEWFYEGHFKDDPCMPGTLMLEGCLQAMAFYVTSLGYTLDRDGWRFEPASEVKYSLRCRGQVVPGARELVYELFIESIEEGPVPTLTADVLGTVDGLAAFHCRRLKLQLVRD